MMLSDEVEVAVTREKLAGLQCEYDAIRFELSGDPFAREVTLRSLKKLINQFLEEIARYESHAGAH